MINAIIENHNENCKINLNEIIRLYSNESKSISFISRILNISRRTIREILIVNKEYRKEQI
jgi:ActR/RegA family two-component response regulator